VSKRRGTRTRALAEQPRVNLPGGQEVVRGYLEAAIAHGLLPAPERWNGRADPGFEPLLPAGMHALTRQELHRIAVAAFPCSSSRSRLWSALDRFLDQIERLVVAREVWVGGSFLSFKPDPGDVDLVVVLKLGRILTLTPAHAVELEDTLEDARSWGVEPRVALEEDLVLRAYLQGLLGFCEDRRRARGIAVLPMTGPPAASGQVES
jgi:hypothetical protein